MLYSVPLEDFLVELLIEATKGLHEAISESAGSAVLFVAPEMSLTISCSIFQAKQLEIAPSNAMVANFLGGQQNATINISLKLMPLIE